MKEEILNVLRCQQCLAKLTFREDKLTCNACDMVYPLSKNLIFMGYDKNRENEARETITTERNHQTNLDDVQKHYNFAYPSFKISLHSIRILKHDVKKQNPVAIDIGSGGTATSKMLSEKGFDTYRCELDPNSLYSGLFWRHSNLCAGKHIVCDASILPFENNSIDVVFCKEFVHHIQDYKSLFNEVNRVLKKDGVFLMIEPTLTIYNHVKSLFKQKVANHPGHHYQTITRYFSALNKTGFLPYRYYLYHYGPSKKIKILNRLKQFCHSQIYKMQETSKISLFLKMFVQNIIGSSNVVFLRKIKNISTYKARPRIQTVEISQLILDENYLNDVRLKKFNEILNEVSNKLRSENFHSKE
ncbi:class I SAM-dependent methyltransferase [Patescibacteria group bacterium]|nr:class I SAM-dependent methyltransferase [Patescibacteria group bacterium]